VRPPGIEAWQLEHAGEKAARTEDAGEVSHGITELDYTQRMGMMRRFGRYIPASSFLFATHPLFRYFPETLLRASTM
jgi:hypothetical protein